MTVDTILGVQAVCARIGVSRATLSRMEKQGTFPARAAGKKPASWQSSQVETWLSERENVEAERTGAVCINTTEPCAYACDAALLRVYLAELDSSLGRRGAPDDTAAQLRARRKVLCVHRQECRRERNELAHYYAIFDDTFAEVTAEIQPGKIITDGAKAQDQALRDRVAELVLLRAPKIQPIDRVLKLQFCEIAAELLTEDDPLRACQQIYAPKQRVGMPSADDRHVDLAVEHTRLTRAGHGTKEAYTIMDRGAEGGNTAHVVPQVLNASGGQRLIAAIIEMENIDEAMRIARVGKRPLPPLPD